ncbi:MAG TPA: class I SAM-dependent methyltransferase [Candidatus Atribacteria bacterium]|nr:class I SAM-dependent methyltransferase [Candidatus Atribacteria bacterium]
MSKKHEHYYTESTDSPLKIYTVSESLRRHLYIFKTTTGIFSFRKIDLGTKVLIENMTIPENPGVFWDLGCGYGAIGIVLAYESPKSFIYMTDINKRAIWCAKNNIKINLYDNIKNVKVIRGSYFEPFLSKDIKFDAIYTNPPIRRGKKEFLNVCKEIPKYLKEGGFFQFVIRRKMGAESIFTSLKEMFPSENINIIRKKSGYWIFDCFRKNLD